MKLAVTLFAAVFHFGTVVHSHLFHLGPFQQNLCRGLPEDCNIATDYCMRERSGFFYDIGFAGVKTKAFVEKGKELGQIQPHNGGGYKNVGSATC